VPSEAADSRFPAVLPEADHVEGGAREDAYHPQGVAEAVVVAADVDRAVAPGGRPDAGAWVMVDILGCQPGDLIEVRVVNEEIRKTADEAPVRPLPTARRTTIRRPEGL
jgi:hypothetical protein